MESYGGCQVEQRLFVYERIGYRVVFVSALNGDGLEDLKQLLAHRARLRQRFAPEASHLSRLTSSRL